MQKLFVSRCNSLWRYAILAHKNISARNSQLTAHAWLLLMSQDISDSIIIHDTNEIKTWNQLKFFQKRLDNDSN